MLSTEQSEVTLRLTLGNLFILQFPPHEPLLDPVFLYSLNSHLVTCYLMRSLLYNSAIVRDPSLKSGEVDSPETYFIRGMQKSLGNGSL